MENTVSSIIFSLIKRIIKRGQKTSCMKEEITDIPSNAFGVETLLKIYLREFFLKPKRPGLGNFCWFSLFFIGHTSSKQGLLFENCILKLLNFWIFEQVCSRQVMKLNFIRWKVKIKIFVFHYYIIEYIFRTFNKHLPIVLF